MLGVCVSRMRGRVLMPPPRSLLPYLACVAIEFQAAEGATLEEVADRIGAELGLLGPGMLEVVLGAPGRPIAVIVGLVVVPPGALVPGGAVEDLETQIRMLEADTDQLGKVLGTDPDRQPALVERPVTDVADAEAEHPQPMLVGVERPQRLAEGLADAIARIRPHGDVDADVVVTRVEADRMVGRGEDDALDTFPARRLEQIVAADDVGLQDRVPGPLSGDAAEVDDPVDAVHNLLDV